MALALALCGVASCGHADVAPSTAGAGSAGGAQTLTQDQIKDIELMTPQEPIGQGRFFVASIQLPRVGTPLDGSAALIEGTFQGHKLEFFPDGDGRASALVGVEVEMKAGGYPLEVTVKTAAGDVRLAGLVQVSEWQFPAETLKVPPRKVAPLKQDLPKIRRDLAELKKAYASHTRKRYWDPPLVMPVDNKITSIFGTRRVYNGIKQSAHYGTDLRAAVGAPIKAPLAGKVALAHDLFFTGGTVILDHGYGFFTIYGHLSKVSVKEGAEVKKGELMGLAGMTGRASGPHLHWGVNLHGVKIDPMALVLGLK